LRKNLCRKTRENPRCVRLVPAFQLSNHHAGSPDDHTEVRSTEPWQLGVTITLGDETLEATLDGDLSLVDAERTRT